MIKVNRGASFIGLVWAILFTGCSHDHPQPTTCTTCPPISFNADIIPIFNQNCATSISCHAGSHSISASLNLDSSVAYSQITQSGTGYIVDSNANYSIAYTQLVSPISASHHMPKGIQLDQCTTQKIYCWIQQGALNN